jgi:plasmid stability protein
MPGWRKNTALDSEVANEQVRAARHRQQDDDFCRALRAALWAEKESCPEGVSTEPGTKNPIINFRLRD